MLGSLQPVAAVAVVVVVVEHGAYLRSSKRHPNVNVVVHFAQIYSI
jgi:hypothetical protein